MDSTRFLTEPKHTHTLAHTPAQMINKNKRATNSQIASESGPFLALTTHTILFAPRLGISIVAHTLCTCLGSADEWRSCQSAATVYGGERMDWRWRGRAGENGSAFCAHTLNTSNSHSLCNPATFPSPQISTKIDKNESLLFLSRSQHLSHHSSLSSLFSDALFLVPQFVMISSRSAISMAVRAMCVCDTLSGVHVFVWILSAELIVCNIVVSLLELNSQSSQSSDLLRTGVLSIIQTQSLAFFCTLRLSIKSRGTTQRLTSLPVFIMSLNE